MKLTSFNFPQIKHEARIVAALIALIAVGGFYYLNSNIIPKIEAETQALENKIEIDAETEKNLSQLYNDMDFYIEETERLEAETEEKLKQFPTFMYLEDKILYQEELVTDDLAEFNITECHFGDSTFVSSVSYGVEDPKTLELYSITFNGSFTDLTYPKVKELMLYGQVSDRRFVMNNMSIGFNPESGYLNGEFSFNTFFVPGQKAPYVFPEEILNSLSGNRIDNLFGSISAPANSTENTEETQNSQDGLTEEAVDEVIENEIANN